jgi:exopolysaccharide production protein ExoQ
MAMISYNDGMVWQTAHASPQETSIWDQAFTWLAIVPVLFITLSGWIVTDATPIAFRFTAMEDESVGRRLVRLACSFLILLLISTRFRAVLQLCRQAKFLLFFPALATVSIMWSRNQSHSLIDALTLWLSTLFAFYIYLKYPREKVLLLLNLGAFIILLLCVLSVTAFPNVGIDPYHEDAWRAVFGQRNTCAVNCTLFLTLGLHMEARGVVERCMKMSVIVLSTFFTFMSASRTGWLLAVLAIIVTYGLRFVARFRSLERILFLMVLTIPTVVLGFLIFNNFTQILAAMDKDATMTQRTVIWAQVIPSIAKHPFIGYGYSGFWQGLNGESMQAILTTGWMEGQAQNGYLDVLLQLGLAGLIPVIVLFLRAGAQGFAALEQKRMDSTTLWAIALMPVILVGNIGESTLVQSLNSSWFYANIAFLILSRPGRGAEDSPC